MYKKLIAQWTFGSLGLVAITGLTIERLLPLQVSPSLVAEREAARRDGMPVYLAELARPLPPSGENAATIYAAMPDPNSNSPQDQAENELQARLLEGADQFSAADWQAVRKTVAEASPRLRDAHEATRRPRCVFAHDYGSPHPGDMPLPELARIRKAARLLSMESLLMAHDGRTVDAAENARLGFRLGDHANEDPMLVGYLCALNIDAITTKTMQNILHLAPNDAAASREVLAALEQDARPRSLKTAIEGDAAFGQTFCETLRVEDAAGLHKDAAGLAEVSGSDRGKISPLSVRALSASTTLGRRYWNYTLDANALAMLHADRTAFAVCDLPYAQAEPVVARAEAKIPTASSSRYFLAALLLPTYSKSLHHRAVASNNESVTKAAAAVLLYRATHDGALPARLDQAMARPPRNAFDDSPLAYRADGSRFTVSAGDPGNPQDKKSLMAFSSR